VKNNILSPFSPVRFPLGENFMGNSAISLGDGSNIFKIKYYGKPKNEVSLTQ